MTLILRAEHARRQHPDHPLGVVYTPREVAGPMVRRALEPLIRGRSSRELRALRVCDFAVGEGVFLVEVIEVIAEALRAAWREEGVAGNPYNDARSAAVECVVGVDVDARAVAVARAQLECGERVRVANALELDWRAEFPDVFANGGFDAVVGNPPYIRQERLSAKAALHGYASAGGVADLYVYFIELAHRIVRRGGRYCLITPNKWLTVEYGRKLRGFLAEQRSVEGLADLGRLALFRDADAFPCIVWGTFGGAKGPTIRASRATSGDVQQALSERGEPHSRIRWGSDPWHIDSPATRTLIERLERASPALGDVLPERPARGVVTGCNRAFVIDGETRARLISEHAASATLIRPFVKGRDIRAWKAGGVDRYILLIDRGTSLDEQPAIARHLAEFRDVLTPRPADHQGEWSGRKPGSYRWHELQDPVGALAASREPRLFYQDIQTGPACALDRDGVVPDTTVWILPTGDRWLLAILNSSFYGWYARHRFPPALNGSVRPKLAYMRALPIAQPRQRARIEELVEQRLVAEGSVARDLDIVIDAAVLEAYEIDPEELV